MKISYKHLANLIEINETPEVLSDLLTATGLEVENIEKVDAVPGGLVGLVIGEVLTCEPHPNADRLRKTTVDIGAEKPLDIVCGAANVATGQKVVIATVGAKLYPASGEPFEINKSKIRGEVSEGMICAEDEIGLGTSHDGIMILDTDVPNGTPAAAHFKLESDYCIEIGLTPNRADAASHFGVARDLKAVNGREISLPEITNFKVIDDKSKFTVTVENEEACPRFCGLEIRGVAVKKSPDWLKNFLTTIGVKSINNIVDTTNYINHFLGQPMHIFDADKVIGKKIVVRVPERGTKLTTLDKIERKLSGFDLAICDAEKPMAIAGVFGGMNSGVSESTKNIFLEVAYFDPAWIRKTATHHSLKTDASFRYERGTDPEMPPYAIKVAALMIQSLAGGECLGEIIDKYPHPIKHKEVALKYRNINRLIGKEIEITRIHQILESLDIKILSHNEIGLTVSVPPYRVDVTREADVIEEILRIYGFDNIELSENLQSDFISEFSLTDSDALRKRVSEYLAGIGFNEIQTLSIVKSEQNTPLSSLSKGDEVKLLNPLNEELSVMRQGLLFSGLQSLAHNINRRQTNLSFFEFGRSYYQKSNGEKTVYKEQQVLGLWITGSKSGETWHHKSEKVDFYDLARAVQQVLSSLKFTLKVSAKPASDVLFSQGLVYEVNKKAVATLGEVKQSHLKQESIKQSVFYAEIDWDYLLKAYSPEVQFQPISKFPEVRRDLSLVIDRNVTFAAIENVALQTERKLLKEVNVFDTYEGENLDKGKKSYSVSFKLLDENQTLTDKVIDKAMNRMMQAFEKELGALIRR
jgi:phenylalanyl-tRNA synthetase beta chain